MLTVSKVDVFSTVVEWLVTDMPAYTAAGSEVVVRPTSVQTEPLLLHEATTVAPARASFSQTGTLAGGDASSVVDPPVTLRIMNSSPPPGRTLSSTCGAFAVSAPRSIRPALA